MKNQIKSTIAAVIILVASTISAQSALLTNCNDNVVKLGGLPKWMGTGTGDVVLVSTLTPVWGADEDVIIPALLNIKAFSVIQKIVLSDVVSQASRTRISNAILTNGIQAKWVINATAIVKAFPLNERLQFEQAFNTYYSNNASISPVYEKFNLKNTTIRGLLLKDVDTVEIVNVLLAPEPLGISIVNGLKSELKTRAIPLARRALRADGKTFVVGADGVNPLTAKIQPLVNALNAPLCIGLESALRGLGVSISDVNRDILSATGKVWADSVMVGDLQPTIYAGKLSVYFGTDAYNEWVVKYNTGK